MESIGIRYLLIQDLPVEVARSCAFSAVLFGNIAFVASEVSPQFNSRFIVTALVLAIVVALISWTPFASLHLSPMKFREIGMAACAGFSGLIPHFIRGQTSILKSECAF